MDTSTRESLFIKEINPEEQFKKVASIARMPDDEKKWAETVLSELQKELPYIADYDIYLNLQRIRPEAGYGFGYAVVKGKKGAMGVVLTKDENKMVKIPIVINEHFLEPFHTFKRGTKVYPLTEKRFEEAMMDPSMFSGAAHLPSQQKSLLDQILPPFQQRSGFGTSDSMASFAKRASTGVSAQDLQDMTPAQMRRLSSLKNYEQIDKANASLSGGSKARSAADSAIFSAGAGGAVGAGLDVAKQLGDMKDDAKGLKNVNLKDVGKASLRGGGFGAASSLAGTAYRQGKAHFRQKDRARPEFSPFFDQKEMGLAQQKEASIEDIPKYGKGDEETSCENCRYFTKDAESNEGICSTYSAPVTTAGVCSSHKGDQLDGDKLASYTKYLLGGKHVNL